MGTVGMTKTSPSHRWYSKSSSVGGASISSRGFAPAPRSTRSSAGLSGMGPSSCSCSVRNSSGRRASNSFGALGVNAARTVVVSPGTSLPSLGVTAKHSTSSPTSSRHVRVPWWWFVTTTSCEKGTRRVSSGVKMRSPKSTVVCERTSIGRRADALSVASKVPPPATSSSGSSKSCAPGALGAKMSSNASAPCGATVSV